MLRVLTRAESAPFVFAAALGLAYGAVPVALSRILDDPYYLQLATVTGVAIPALILGSRLSLLDGLAVIDEGRLGGRVDGFLVAVWAAFGLLVLVACVTAEQIPLVAAIQGVDAETLVVLRERFLKAREGWQAILPYLNAVLAGALVPYSVMLALVHRHRRAWLLFGLFFLYCVSFVEKAYFLKAAIPLTYLVAQRRIGTWLKPRFVVLAGVAVLAVVTILSGVGERDAETSGEDFFSATYAANDAATFIVWRGVAIPLVTAADTFRVFEEQYGGQPLLGASSSFLAGVSGRERVNVEHEVFATQWGQTETESGSANSVYLTEAFLNYGWAGVVVFSLLVGLILRVFARTRDEALRSLWMLLCFGIFVAPLTGTLVSGGFFLVIGVSRYLGRSLDETPGPCEGASTSAANSEMMPGSG